MIRSVITTLLAATALSAAAFNRAAWLDQRRNVHIDAAKMSQAYVKYAALVREPAENVTIPIQSYPDGKVRSSVFAAKAYLFLKEDLVWGADVHVREFDPAGKVTASFRAKNILVDRRRKVGWVPSSAEIEYSGTIVAGRGNYVDFNDKFISISSSAKVVSRNLQLKDALSVAGRESAKPGAKPGAKGGADAKPQVKIATITAERADYDNGDGVILFEGDVVAGNDEYDLRADRVYIFLEGTNRLSRVVAEGSVTLTNGVRNVSCAQAVFNRVESKLVLFGDESAPARMCESGERAGEVTGSRIVYWTDSEQIEVRDSSITVDAAAIRGDQLKEAITSGPSAAAPKTAKKKTVRKKPSAGAKVPAAEGEKSK